LHFLDGVSMNDRQTLDSSAASTATALFEIDGAFVHRQARSLADLEREAARLLVRWAPDHSDYVQAVADPLLPVPTHWPPGRANVRGLAALRMDVASGLVTPDGPKLPDFWFEQFLANEASANCETYRVAT